MTREEAIKESQERFNKDSETESMLNADLVSRQAQESKKQEMTL